MNEAERASRALRGRIGVHRLHATHDPRETTKAARHAFWSSFERGVDPSGLLAPEERSPDPDPFGKRLAASLRPLPPSASRQDGQISEIGVTAHSPWIGPARSRH